MAGRRRPVEERNALADAILDLMATEANSGYTACRAMGVPLPTFLLWCDQDKSLAERYARAREEMIERIASQTIDIADEPVGTTDNGSTDSGAVQKQKLQVDTRKWLLSKLAPKRYGDKITLAGDEENPVMIAKAPVYKITDQ